MYQDLITNWNDSDFIYQPIPILKQFVREYVPQFSVNHIMNTYWDAEFLFDKLSGHSTYTVDENDPTKTVATVVIEPAAAFRHIQPMISTVETRPYCCRENKVEEIARKGYINIVTDEEHNQTIQELVEERLNEDRILNDAYECPHCERVLPRCEVTERLVESISALPVFLRNMDRRPIEFGNDITIESLNDGPIQFTLIGCIQFTGNFFHSSSNALHIL